MRMSYARSSQRNGSKSSAVYEEGAEILKRPVSPLPKGRFRLRQLSNLLRLPAAAVPVDPLIAERCETQGQIASIKALGVPTDCNDRLARSPPVSSAILRRKRSWASSAKLPPNPAEP